MSKFSILVQVQDPLLPAFQRMLDSVQAQTFTDWELVLVVSQQAQADRLLLADLAAINPQLRVEVRNTDELLAWSCNALLPTLGTWTGFLGQHDCLTPTALAEINATLQTHTSARVIYTDEEARNIWDLISLRTQKGAVDGMRLCTQEYLRDLAMFQTAWLQTLGGFDPLASDRPTHDLYLRTLEQLGPSAFHYIPQRLYQRFRNYLTPSTDPRRKPHMVDYDLHAVRQHFARCELPATADQVNGTVELAFSFDRTPSVHAILVVGDDTVAGIRAIKSLGIVPVYQPLTIQVLFHGSTDEASDTYETVCAGERYRYRRISGDLVPALNQEGRHTDSDFVLFLQGAAINPFWLQRLVDYAQLPGIGATGARTLSPKRLTQPGVLGWKYEGWDWNSRGRFNQLSVPHQVAAVSPTCLLVDARTFTNLGGFDPSYPSLYGMDYCLRLSQANLGVVFVPGSQVHVEETSLPPAEVTQFGTEWAGWVDPYGLHQLP